MMGRYCFFAQGLAKLVRHPFGQFPSVHTSVLR